MVVNQRAGKAHCEYCETTILLEKESLSSIIRARYEAEKQKRSELYEVERQREISRQQREDDLSEQAHRRKMETIESIKGFIPFAQVSQPGNVIKMPLISNVYSYSSMHYNAIAAEIKGLGFTNVSLVPLYDLRKGLFGSVPEENEMVAKITANGRAILPLQSIPANAAIVISFHCLRK